MLPSPRPCGNPPRICGFRTPWRRPGRRVRDCGTAGASAAEPRTIARVRSLARPFVAVERRCHVGGPARSNGRGRTRPRSALPRPARASARSGGMRRRATSPVPRSIVQSVRARSTMQRIMDNVAPWANPVRADHACHVPRQRRHRDDAAPGDRTGKFRFLGAEQGPADLRMHAVAPTSASPKTWRPSSRSRLTRSPEQSNPTHREPRWTASRFSRRTSSASTPSRSSRPNRPIRKAVALDRFGPEVEEVPGLAGLPVADFLARGCAGQSFERIENPHGVERPGSLPDSENPGKNLVSADNFASSQILTTHSSAPAR